MDIEQKPRPRWRFLRVLVYCVVGVTIFVILFMFGVHVLLFAKSSSGREVVLKIRGENLNNCAGWRGESFCPTSWDFAYEISTIEVTMLDSELKKAVGNTIHSLGRYVDEHPGEGTVYIPLEKDNTLPLPCYFPTCTVQPGDLWKISGEVSLYPPKIQNVVFIKGKLNGGGHGSGTSLSAVTISYPPIATSQTIVPFVDFDSVYTKDDTARAVSLLKKRRVFDAKKLSTLESLTGT